ncbi:MAG: oligoendopeptidase F [Lactobacillaceae bacterium]|jgi:oligoendopeptidase F|nr:oligoendopeptidase F [Lactobacillaceae bacterium]
MSESKQQIKRSEVPEELTWDLTSIYANNNEWEKAFKKVQEDSEQLAKLKGTLTSGSNLFNFFQKLFTASRELEKVYVFAQMRQDQDAANQENVALSSRAMSLIAEFSSATSFVEPELNEIKPATLENYFNQEPKLNEFKFYIEKIVAGRDHVLPAEQEQLLASAAELFHNPEKTFGVLNNADLKFGDVTDENGQQVELTQGVYSIMLESPNREIRKIAFETLYAQYKKFKNTFATTISGNVKVHNYLAKSHKFQTAREAATFNNKVPASVFQTLVTSVDEHLDLLHRFVSLRKKILGISDLHPYDLYTPIAGEVDFPVTFETAKEITLKALAPLGEEYLAGIKRAFNERWIDVVENSGKRGGAYSSGVYDTNPYILLNWQDNLNNLYTLVHELGHSMHSLYTRTNQPYQYGDYPIFLAEIASTTNEALLTEYLLKTYNDKDIQIFVLNQYLDGFKGTVFRQTQFAEFEDWMHKQDQAGVALTSEVLSDYYSELNQKFYGPDLEKDSNIALEWSRIPHFYYNYYVYQYSTGEAAATTLAQGIVDDPTKNVPLYLEYLKSGSSNYPVEIMKKAGVDMSSKDYLESAFNVFKTRLEQFEQLISK